MSPQSYVKKNLSLAWPLALNALLMQSMLMIDTLLISPLGEISLAAMGIASTIVFFVLGIQIALANGTQLVLSRAYGSGAENSLRKGLWSGMSINLSVAMLFFALIKLFDRQLIGLLTDDASLTTEVLRYLDVSLYIVLFNAITQVMIALFNAVGRTKIPFKGYLLELPINVAASYLLIFGTGDWDGLGVQGAAAGSLIAIFVRMLFLGSCVRLYHAPLLDWSKLDASLRQNMRNHFKEIFPVAANMTMLQTGATIYMLILSQLPLSAYVAITLIMPWVRAGTQFITAWAHSSAITVSQAIGSGQMGDLRKNVDVSIDIAVVISLFSALLFAALSLVLPHIYPDLDDATYYALMAIAPLYIFLPIVRGYNTVHGHVLRALGRTTSVFKINFTGQWVISLPLCALIVIGLDGSIFWAFAVFPIEELVKMLPFRYLARKSLDEFDMSKAEKLMYD
ncbi:MATE family efflux transporter [Vibrio sp. 188UL20-2]|uniref:MATE family efflux transporter n=2 Tax=Vibrio ulleungensis TaxID=2807619 RepID=A0ABS2HI24_9VIBR|nr:MATE family efflux transporter [Vibrio ulleungensis]MBM7037188.1 MATE family efflux transporter [Vibrio ulleungensis]